MNWVAMLEWGGLSGNRWWILRSHRMPEQIYKGKGASCVPGRPQQIAFSAPWEMSVTESAANSVSENKMGLAFPPPKI